MCLLGGWRLSVSGIDIPHEPHPNTVRWMREVHINRKTLTEDELVSPLWDTCNIEL
jgi:hypothetical protein